MKLYTMFISYRNGGYYCGLYPSIEDVYNSMVEFVHQLRCDNEIGDENNVKDLIKLKAYFYNNNNYMHTFSSNVWFVISEIPSLQTKSVINKIINLLKKSINSILD